MAVAIDHQRRREELRAQYAGLRLPADEDDLSDSPCPVYDQFVEVAGTRGIEKLTNFTNVELDIVWASIATDATALWRRHRGPASRYQAKDVFFMMVSVFKNGGKWQTNAKVFDVKEPTFQRMITKFIGLVAPLLSEAWINSQCLEYPMHVLVTSGNTFANYPSAHYATDVTFQQANTPKSDPDVFYSAKHKLHGLKVEVSVLPTGRAINCTRAYPGTQSDIGIFRNNINWHRSQLLKKGSEQNNIPDEDPLKDRYPDQWSVLVDKDYIGLADAREVSMES
ncbi:hypothetical protein ATCC90586_011082 [Pythium insidiosum]|nr:hypothetical protein ATCC90586_011082 [Pythium insidiosum]